MNREIQKQVASNCATYAGNGRCLLDRHCPFFDSKKEGARCEYYENSVLPSDVDLYNRYWMRFGLAYWGADAKTCGECGKGFEAKSNAQKYCESCSTEVKRRQKSAQNRRSYERSKNKE